MSAVNIRVNGAAVDLVNGVLADVAPIPIAPAHSCTGIKVARFALVAFAAFGFYTGGLMIVSAHTVSFVLKGLATIWVSGLLLRMRGRLHDFSDPEELQRARREAPHMNFPELLARFSLTEILAYQLVSAGELQAKCVAFLYAGRDDLFSDIRPGCRLVCGLNSLLSENAIRNYFERGLISRDMYNAITQGNRPRFVELAGLIRGIDWTIAVEGTMA